MLKIRYNGSEKLLGFNPKSLSKPFYLLDRWCVNITSFTLYNWITIPKGFVSDGCSIPFLFRLILGCKHHPQYVTASIIHDWLVENPQVIDYNRRLASEIFYTVLIQEGVNKFIAWLMFTGVEIGQIYNTIFKGKWRK